MASGMVGNQTVTMATNGKPVSYDDLTLRSSDEAAVHTVSPGGQVFTNGTNGWSGSSIWGSSGLSTGFGSASRDGPSPRGWQSGSQPSQTSSAKRLTSDRASTLGNGADPVKAKSGSGLLVPSSESESWARQRSPWTRVEAGKPAASQGQRSTSATPVNHRLNTAVPPIPHSFANGALNSAGSLGHRSGYRGQYVNGRQPPQADPELVPVDLSLSTELLAQTSGGGTFLAENDETRRSVSTFAGPWADPLTHQSPVETRRGVSDSEYMGVLSLPASRNNSLPPSRHGAEFVQFPQGMEIPARSSHAYMTPGGRGHLTTLSSQFAGQTYLGRTEDVQSGLTSRFGRLEMDPRVNPASIMHKSSMSVDAMPNPHTFIAQENGISRQATTDASSTVSRRLENTSASSRSFTPDDFSVGVLVDQVGVSRESRSGDKAIRLYGSMDRHHSSSGSTEGTPLSELVYPRSDQTARYLSNGHSALLERKLRHLQQEQINYVHPHIQQAMAAPQSKGHFASYGYGGSNAITMNAFGQAYPMYNLQPNMPGPEPPKAPRDYEASHSLRSALLEDFKLNSKTRRWELKAIFNHIVEFSGDQHGSRFIQQKLETANSDEKERVFREIEPNSMQLMTDVFGNYVIQKFFEHGDQNQKKVLANRMKGQVLNLSLQMYACRVVQKALEHILVDQQAALIKELDGNVLRCVKDQNGNHVIQKAIERIPTEHISFIIDAFTGQVQQLATHAYGCRVIQRLLEYCEEPARTSILQELHACGSALIPDQYGNYVAQHVIQHGRPEDRAKVISLIKAQLLPFSAHKFASNVVEKCLVYATDEQRQELMTTLVEKNERGESSLIRLIKDGYGNYVLQKLLDTLNGDDYAKFVGVLQPEMAKAKKIVTGKNVPAVEKKMRRFEKAETGEENARLRSTSPDDNSVRASAIAPPSETSDSSGLKVGKPSLGHSDVPGNPSHNHDSEDHYGVNRV